MIVAVVGPEKTGKTTFALSWPGKLVFFNLEQGFDRVEPARRPPTDTVVIKTYKRPDEVDLMDMKAIREGWRPLFNAIYTDYNAALEDPTVSTIVFDTATMLWRILCDAFLEKLNTDSLATGGHGRFQLQQMEYGLPNSMMATILDKPKSYGKNLVLVHHEADEYVPGPPDNSGRPTSVASGKKTWDGYRKTGTVVDYMIKMRAVMDSAGNLIPQGEITLSGVTLKLVGQVFNNPSYQVVNTMIRVLRSEGSSNGVGAATEVVSA